MPAAPLGHRGEQLAVEVADRALAGEPQLGRARREQERGALAVRLDPAEVVPHERLDRLLGRLVAPQLDEHPALVVAQRLDLNRRRELLLAAEVVVDRADADAGPVADLLDAGALVSALREDSDRRLEDFSFVATLFALTWRADASCPRKKNRRHECRRFKWPHQDGQGYVP